MARQKVVSSPKDKNSKKTKVKKNQKKTSKSKSRHSNAIETEDECGSSSTYKQLLKFKKVEELLYLASRIFQKEPQIYDNVQNAQKQSFSKYEEPGIIRQSIFSTINEIIQNAGGLNSTAALDSSRMLLPKRWENYIAFCDLVYVSRNISHEQWSTFVLQDYQRKLHIEPTNSEDENDSEVEFRDQSNIRKPNINRPYLPLHKIRKRLKKFLIRSGACETEDEQSEGDILASVQVDMSAIPEDYRYDNPNSVNEDMILIRIVTSRKTRNLAKDRNNLLTRKSTFFVYFPGEAYFYSTKAKPNVKYCQALVDCLYCKSYIALPLSDRDVFSLRRLRMNRDTLCKNSCVMSSILDDSLIGYYNKAVLSRYAIDGETHHRSATDESDDQPSEFQEKLPFLRRYQVKCLSEYDGGENVFRSKESSNNPSQNINAFDKLDISVQFSGNDILNAFSSMAQYTIETSSKSKYFETTLPKWLKESACRGRNTVTIVHNKKPPMNNEQEDDDAMSIAASEMTNWGGTRKIGTLKLSEN